MGPMLLGVNVRVQKRFRKMRRYRKYPHWEFIGWDFLPYSDDAALGSARAWQDQAIPLFLVRSWWSNKLVLRRALGVACYLSKDLVPAMQERERENLINEGEPEVVHLG